MVENQWFILHLYPSLTTGAEGVVYSDAGEGYGVWRLDRFQLIQQPNGWQLQRQQQGDFPFPYRGFRLHFHGVSLQQIWVDEQAIAEITQVTNDLAIEQFDCIRFQGSIPGESLVELIAEDSAPQVI